MDSPNEVLHIKASDHITGRLASRIAKKLLQGAEVHVYNCEEIVFPFCHERARSIYKSYLNKRCLVNPRKGPFHYVEPSKYFRRMVRGMLSHKKKMGEAALNRLHCYESMPENFKDLNLQVCPVSARKFKQNPIRKFYPLGLLMREVGWKHYDVVKELNDKQKVEFEAEKEKLQANVDKLVSVRCSSEVQNEVQKRLKLLQ